MPSEVIKGEYGKPVINLCTVDLLPGVIEGQLFDGLTITKGGDYFCHVGWIHVGRPSMLEKNAQRFVDNLAKVVEEVGAKEVICYHDDCYVMLAVKAKEFGVTVPFKPVHIIEYLRDYVKKHQDRVKKLNIRVAYQQPCASRYTLWKDKILDELFASIGVERVNRKYDRLSALCCTGAMAGMSTYTKDKIEEWRMKNIIDAKKVERKQWCSSAPYAP